MSVGSLLTGAYEAVILSPIIDVIGGAILFYRNPVTDSKLFWIPLTIAMTIGSVIGAVVLVFFTLSTALLLAILTSFKLIISLIVLSPR